jgi:hypothetical protein
MHRLRINPDPDKPDPDKPDPDKNHFGSHSTVSNSHRPLPPWRQGGVHQQGGHAAGGHFRRGLGRVSHDSLCEEDLQVSSRHHPAARQVRTWPKKTSLTSPTKRPFLV